MEILRRKLGQELASKLGTPSLWPERTASSIAIGGVLFSILVGFHAHTWQGSGSDFKTMYASATCLIHGVDGYQFSNLGAVFVRDHVVLPGNWYGHAPVYPPFTIALLAPLTVMPMIAAVYVWIIFSAVAMAAAVASLARVAKERYGLSRPWRMLLIGLAAASPLLSFGLEMGNVSVMVAALSLLAVTARDGNRIWWRAIGLAGALLLKPHLALWVLVAMLLVPDRTGRVLALRAASLAAAGATLLCGLVAATRGMAEFTSYHQTLMTEMSAGSMSAHSRDLLAASAQITSLTSFLGFGMTRDAEIHVLSFVALIAMLAILIWTAVRMDDLHGRMRLPLVATFCSFGLLATYHRAHDGVILMVMLPWLISRLRNSWRDPLAWAMLALQFCMGAATTWESMEALATYNGFNGVANMLLYRQAPLALALLAISLTTVTTHSVMMRRTAHETQAESLRVVAA